MDARTLSADDARELADLRRRAYGPGADIADDPAAVRRLRELEDGRRSPADAVAPTAAERVAAVARAVPSSSPAAAEAPVGDAADTHAAASSDAPAVESARPRRWWRRAPVWSIVAIALIVGVGVGAGSIYAAAPRADVVLRVAPSEGGRDANWLRELRTWGISPDTAVPFEQYKGVGVWTAMSDEGSRCLVLENGVRPIHATCVGGGFDPILDLTMYGGQDEFLDDPPPAGSVIRFIAREGAVEVWVRERQSVAASASEIRPSSR
ncbi:hypothetical protein [Microbacterium sp. SLBN-146]|uniref:hypothetical protein n=1 Tax=Microbacterium sp. SLBN-146 TaxID=2768457 RepID=UPI001154F13D|nr:hypothetical protein [Microbacterium sp. SLBN-146]TQJ31884.1 hypothetical protein FBY39_2372 [Microbacterium sp. SLBN-146]